MHSAGTVIGYVAEVIVEEKATLVVIEDRTGEKVRSTVARARNEKTKAQAAELKPGSLIKVEGYISSNRSTQGRWFTEFAPSFIKVLSSDNGEF
ncbi:MAG: hypothetical protein M3R04_02435 [bacterium]|nr:hypothetical protein [bacterium]